MTEPQTFVRESQFNRLCDEVKANTALTQELQKSTQDVVSAFAAAKGAFAVLETIGRLAKPIAFIVTITGGALTAYNKWKG